VKYKPGFLKKNATVIVDPNSLIAAGAECMHAYVATIRVQSSSSIRTTGERETQRHGMGACVT
jgi:hypothetical protein